MILSIGLEGLKTILYLSAPLLCSSMLIGVLVSVFQAVTQINEATLSFIPKVVILLVVLTTMGPWMMEVLQSYTVHAFGGGGEWGK